MFNAACLINLLLLMTDWQLPTTIAYILLWMKETSTPPPTPNDAIRPYSITILTAYRKGHHLLLAHVSIEPPIVGGYRYNICRLCTHTARHCTYSSIRRRLLEIDSMNFKFCALIGFLTRLISSELLLHVYYIGYNRCFVAVLLYNNNVLALPSYLIGWYSTGGEDCTKLYRSIMHIIDNI